MKPKKGKGNFAPAVQHTMTFGKKKIKVGRVLKKTNVTDSSISTKKVVLLEQLKGENTGIVSHRGLSLQDLCKQLGHFNEGVRRDAIIGVKQLLENNPEQIPKNLRSIVPCIGNQISTGVGSVTTRSQLKALIKLICGVSSDVISSHFDLLLVHVLKGISDSHLDIRFFAFDVLITLMEKYQKLCSKKMELFDGYLLLMGGQRRPTKLANVFQSIALFLAVFGVSHQTSFWSQQDAALSIDGRSFSGIQQILPSREALYFPVLYSSSQGNVSPLYTQDGLLKACNVLVKLIAILVAEQERGKDSAFVLAQAKTAASKLVEITKKFKQEYCPGQEYERSIDKELSVLKKCWSINPNELFREIS